PAGARRRAVGRRRERLERRRGARGGGPRDRGRRPGGRERRRAPRRGRRLRLDPRRARAARGRAGAPGYAPRLMAGYNYERFDEYVETGVDEREFAAFPNMLHAGERAPDGELLRLDDGSRVRLSE